MHLKQQLQLNPDLDLEVQKCSLLFWYRCMDFVRPELLAHHSAVNFALNVNVELHIFLAISIQDFDNSGETGPQAKGVNHLETPLRQVHVTQRASSCAKRGGHVQLCSKPRGARRIAPVKGVSFNLVLRPLDISNRCGVMLITDATQTAEDSLPLHRLQDRGFLRYGLEFVPCMTWTYGAQLALAHLGIYLGTYLGIQPGMSQRHLDGSSRLRTDSCTLGAHM